MIDRRATDARRADQAARDRASFVGPPLEAALNGKDAPMTTPGLVRYNAACKALAAAKAVDEVKDIRNKAEAMRAYAKQAKNRQMELDAAELRVRAERRLGELIAAQRETVGLAKPPGKKKKIGSDSDPISQPTLADADIDKHLADRARTLARMSDENFESMVRSWRRRGQDETARVTTDLIRAQERREQHARDRAADAKRRDRQVLRVVAQAFQAIGVSLSETAKCVGIAESEAITAMDLTVLPDADDSFISAAHSVIDLAWYQCATQQSVDAAHAWLIDRTRPDQPAAEDATRIWERFGSNIDRAIDSLTAAATADVPPPALPQHVELRTVARNQLDEIGNLLAALIGKVSGAASGLGVVTNDVATPVAEPMTSDGLSLGPEAPSHRTASRRTA
jgi:hypothetical protein